MYIRQYRRFWLHSWQVISWRCRYVRSTRLEGASSDELHARLVLARLQLRRARQQSRRYRLLIPMVALIEALKCMFCLVAILIIVSSFTDGSIPLPNLKAIASLTFLAVMSVGMIAEYLSDACETRARRKAGTVVNNQQSICADLLSARRVRLAATATANSISPERLAGNPERGLSLIDTALHI